MAATPDYSKMYVDDSGVLQYNDSVFSDTSPVQTYTPGALQGDSMGSTPAEPSTPPGPTAASDDPLALPGSQYLSNDPSPLAADAQPAQPQQQPLQAPDDPLALPGSQYLKQQPLQAPDAAAMADPVAFKDGGNAAISPNLTQEQFDARQMLAAPQTAAGGLSLNDNDLAAAEKGWGDSAYGVSDAPLAPAQQRQMLDQAEVDQAVLGAKAKKTEFDEYQRQAVKNVKAVRDANDKLNERMRLLAGNPRERNSRKTLEAFIDSQKFNIGGLGSSPRTDVEARQKIEGAQKTLAEMDRTQNALDGMDKHREDAQHALALARQQPAPMDPEHVAALVQTRQSLEHAHEDYLTQEAVKRNAREDAALAFKAKEAKSQELDAQLKESEALGKPYEQAGDWRKTPHNALAARKQSEILAQTRRQAEKEGYLKPGQDPIELEPKEAGKFDQEFGSNLDAALEKNFKDHNVKSPDEILRARVDLKNGFDPDVIQAVRDANPNFTEAQIKDATARVLARRKAKATGGELTPVAKGPHLKY